MTLQPYAVSAKDSLGRVHDEPDDPLRDAFELDRHRILSSAAFRRLQYKTQVFVTDEHDHFRTRLTHSLEVAEVSRRLAVAIGVNERLAEVIALSHDLGHPPFGHAAEAMLRECMASAGGFEHNLQTLRIVDYLEHPYPAHRGLNLSYEVREGIVKHSTAYDKPESGGSVLADWDDLLETGPLPSVEGQIASLADRIAYDCHDLEDALGASLVDRNALNEITLWRDAAADVRREFPDANIFAVRRPILTAMMTRLISDGAAETKQRAEAAGVRHVDDVRRLDHPVVAFSKEVEALVGELEGFLAERVYRHHRLVRMDAKARRFIARIFEEYLKEPAMLPPRFANRIDEQGTERVVCDYIAGMTDRFCQDEYLRLFAPHERV